MPSVRETTVTELIEAGRWDAEYFQAAHLADATRLHSDAYPRLGSLAKITCSAFYPAATGHYLGDAGGGVPFIRCVDVNDFPVILPFQRFERLPPEFVAAHKSIRTATAGDVIISKVGSPCYASYLDAGVGPVALTRTVLGLSKIEGGLNPYYLVAFLRSRYGFAQLFREREQQIQFQLTLDRVRRIRVFVAEAAVQEEIGGLVERYARQSLEAANRDRDTVALFEAELGISPPSLSPSQSYAASLSQVFHAGRWDSEFYRPKYDRVREAVLGATRIPVRDLVPLSRFIGFLTNGHTPLRHNLTVGEVLFITAEHVSSFKVDTRTEKRILVSHHAGELRRTALREGDLLITIKGKVGDAAAVKNLPGPANINQDVALLRLRPGVHPYFVMGWFNSVSGRLFVEQRSTGGINPFLGLGNLRRMPVPAVSRDAQDSVGESIQQAAEAAESAVAQASGLLDEAIRRVEALIEAQVPSRA